MTAEELDAEMRGLLQPVLNAVENGAAPEELLGMLAELVPEHGRQRPAGASGPRHLRRQPVGTAPCPDRIDLAYCMKLPPS